MKSETFFANDALNNEKHNCLTYQLISLSPYLFVNVFQVIGNSAIMFVNFGCLWIILHRQPLFLTCPFCLWVRVVQREIKNHIYHDFRRGLDIHMGTQVFLPQQFIEFHSLIFPDRYWSITSPLRYLRKRTKKRALIMITMAWIGASMWFIPVLGWNQILRRGKSQLPGNLLHFLFS